MTRLLLLLPALELSMRGQEDDDKAAKKK